MVPRMLDESHIEFDASLRLQEISTLLIQEGNLESLYERVLDAAVCLMAADVGSMQKYDAQQDELQLLATRGFPPEAIEFWQQVNRQSGTSCGRALSLGRRVVVPEIETAEFMAGSADLDIARRVGLRAMHSTPLISRSGRLLGMISTHWQQPHSPAEHELRTLDVLARQAADLIERVEVETALREGEHRLQRLASIVESSHDAIVSKDLRGTITTWNKAAELLFGYTAREAIGQPITILIPLERQGEEFSILDRTSRGERIENYETVRRRKDGSSVDVSLTISPVRNAEGKIVGASKIVRDITMRKLAEAREAMLIAELDHRVKNILAQVAVVAKATRQGSSSVDEFLRSLDGRIQSMAAAHTLLSHSGWHGVGVDALVRDQLAPYATDTNITISGTDVTLAAAEVQALTRVLHELATNAAKYGALSSPNGKVSVSWKRGTNGKATNLTFQWNELGGPPVPSKIQASYGTNLIRNLIAHELGGKTDLVFGTNGVNCKLEFPISEA